MSTLPFQRNARWKKTAIRIDAQLNLKGLTEIYS